MAKAGAKIIGINCNFDPFLCLETLKEMKSALDEAGLSVHLMAQPLGYRTPDVDRYGWTTLPEYPYGMSLILSDILISGSPQRWSRVRSRGSRRPGSPGRPGSSGYGSSAAAAGSRVTTSRRGQQYSELTFISLISCHPKCLMTSELTNVDPGSGHGGGARHGAGPTATR